MEVFLCSDFFFSEFLTNKVSVSHISLKKKIILSFGIIALFLFQLFFLVSVKLHSNLGLLSKLSLVGTRRAPLDLLSRVT